jgi:hypothetical protein
MTFLDGFHNVVAVFFQESMLFLVLGLPIVGIDGAVSVSKDSVDELLSKLGLFCSVVCCLEVEG